MSTYKEENLLKDKIIIKYIKSKNEKGLELLLENYGGLIRGAIRKHLSSLPYYQDECINDVLISIWNNIDSFDCKGSFQSWIVIISKFKAIDYKRKYLKHNNFEDIDKVLLSDNKDLSENLLYEELQNEIKLLLDNLKPEDKVIFTKYYLEDIPTDTISKELGLPKTQIYNKLSRGRKKLFSILKNSLNEVNYEKYL